jgi:site-specific DNA recombinase
VGFWYVIPEPILNWLSETVLESDWTEQAAREQSIKRLQSQHDQIEARIERMYLDKLDGRITEELFDRNSAAWRRDQQVLQRKIQNIQNAAPAPIDQALDMLRLTSRASELFRDQASVEQRRLLQVVLEKAAWQEGELRTSLFEPFEILRHSNQESSRKEKENDGSGCDLKIWLPSLDTFRTFAACPTPSMRAVFQSLTPGMVPWV